MKNDQIMSGWLRAIIDSADDAIISKTLDGVITSWNKGAAQIFGYTADEVVGQSVLMLIPEDHRSEEAEILAKIRSGERVEHFETVRVAKDGRLIDVSLTVSPVRNDSGKIVGASKILRDVTDRKLIEKERREVEIKLHEQNEVVETINKIGAILSAELDMQKLVQAVTDAATDLTSAQFGAFFYNLLSEDGGSYLLYSLSGVSHEEFANFPMPRATELFGPTFRGETTIRIDNVKEDARYGKSEPYKGMPSGHLPVTSYLAVAVKSRAGEVIGGLFFGHSDPGVFTERHERIVEGLAAQVAIAMDNARLYESAQRAIKDKDALLTREQEAREEAELANRAKDEFLGLLSHELRTPLNSILGWTRLLHTETLDAATMARAMETIDRNAKLQARLIDDMLDVSRIISGKLRLDAQPLDLTTVINASVDTLRPAAEARGIRLYVTLDFGAESILGDPVRLQQVIWNLISNAIKFTPKDGSIRVSLQRINSHLEISVIDSGSGIDEAFLPYVFDRFRQADSSSSKKYGGLGLGLSIVRHLVELHGGTVEAGNREDSPGAVFTVKLPVMAVHKHTERKAIEFADTPSFSTTTLALSVYPRLDGVKILAVDDEVDARQLLTVLLEQCGAEVRTCESVTEALQSVKDFEPDILVSDIGMPDEDGYSLIKKLRAAETESGKHLPAIALTAFARAEDRYRALSAGFNMHVPKPVEPAELTLVISRLVK